MLMPISALRSTLVKAKLVNWAVLVRGEYLGLAEAGQGILQGGDAEASIHGARKPPTQHLAGRPVYGRHQVEEPAPP